MNQREPGQGPKGVEMRRGDRRQADRRQAGRGGRDRRRGDRRAGMCAGTVLTLSALAFVPGAQADIFTRKNASGVTEATNLPSSSDFKLVYRSKGVVIHSPGFVMRPSANHDFDDHIQAAAAAHGVSEQLIRAVIQVESQFDRLAVSTAGARGLMQLMPATARMLGVADSFDARQNIFGGAFYLKQLLRRYGGDVSLAAAAYNAGEGAVAKYNGIPPYKETQGYVRKVNAILGTAVAAVAAEIPAMFIAAGEGARMNPPPAPRTVGGRILAAATRPKGAAAKPTPRVYFRWKDAKGVLHMSETPPPSGEYTTIKSSS